MQVEKKVDVEGKGASARRRVLAAALEEVRERPLAEVQLRHIAKRAGMSPGHVLYHFGSKDQILVETLGWSEGQIAEDRALQLSAVEDPVVKLEQWITLYLPREANDPTWKLWVELWLRTGLDQDLRQIPRAAGESWMNDFHEILTAGLESGAFRLAEPPIEFLERTHSLVLGISIGVMAGWQSLDNAKRLALQAAARDLRCTFPGLSAT